MFKSVFRKLAGPRGNRILIATGMLLSLFALYKLLGTAMYVHESVIVSATVTDVRQQPFESTCQALQNGNWAVGGSTSYQAIVRYTVPNGLVINRMMTDYDDTDYQIGDEVQVITPELDPSQAHVYKWKFIWGWECMQMGSGVLLLLLGLLLRERPKVSAAPTAPKGKRKTGGTRTGKSGAPRKRTPRKKKQD